MIFNKAKLKEWIVGEGIACDLEHISRILDRMPEFKKMTGVGANYLLNREHEIEEQRMGVKFDELLKEPFFAERK